MQEIQKTQNTEINESKMYKLYYIHKIVYSIHLNSVAKCFVCMLFSVYEMCFLC